MNRVLVVLVCLAAVGLAIAATGCLTSDEMNGGSSFVIDINNQWTVDGDTSHGFFFSPTNSGPAAAGDFTGSESGYPSTGDFFILSGSYTGQTITFVIERPAPVPFKGTILDQNTMQIESIPAGESYTITRNTSRKLDH